MARVRAAAWMCLAVLLICAAAAAGQQKPQEKPPEKPPLDLNAATVEQLQELPGVGPSMAQRIIDMRKKSGPFRRVEDLLAVRGISKKRFEALQPYVIVSAPPPGAQ